MPSTSLVPLTVLLDTGIFSHSEFAEGAIAEGQIAAVHGVRRKIPKVKPELQAQINALPTVGRLIREGIIIAYEYREIWCERIRYRALLPYGNALRDCEIATCNSPLDRTKFRRTSNIGQYLAKGGKKDQKSAVAGTASQIAFLKFLFELEPGSVEALILNAQLLRLTEFEIESLRNLKWFQFLCERSQSSENYRDVFHLWAAERNGLEVFLILEERLPNLVSRVRSEKIRSIEIRTQVLRPLQLLSRLGIEQLDPVQVELGRFYNLHELE